MAERRKAILAHAVEGRVRLVLPEARGDRTALEEVVQTIAQLPPVRHVEARPRTGSVVIVYDGPAEDLLAASDGAGLLDLAHGPEGGEGSAADAALERAQMADLLFRLKTGGALDARSLAFLLFAGLGVVQLARGGPLWPPAATAFWYAGSALMMGAGRKEG